MIETTMRSVAKRSGLLLQAAWLSGFLAVAAGAQEPPPEAPAQIAVSPSRVELTLDGGAGATEAVRVFNLGKEPVEVRVSVATWELDEANQVRLVEPDEQSLETWMVINPLRFTLPPGESQAVRFAVRPRVEPTPGEHRAMIYLSQEPPPSVEGAVRVRFRFGVAVYGYAGDVERRGELVEAVVDVEDPETAPEARLRIASRGNAHVRLAGRWALWPADAYPGKDDPAPLPDPSTFRPGPPQTLLAVGKLPETPVLPGATRSLEFPLTAGLAAGDYVLEVRGHLSRMPIHEAIRFTVPPPATHPEKGEDLDGEPAQEVRG